MEKEATTKEIIAYFNRKFNEEWSTNADYDSDSREALAVIYYSMPGTTPVDALAKIMGKPGRPFVFQTTWHDIAALVISAGKTIAESESIPVTAAKIVKDFVITLIKATKFLKNEERCMCFILASIAAQQHKIPTVDDVKQAYRYDSGEGEFVCPLPCNCIHKNQEDHSLCAYHDPNYFVDMVLKQMDNKGIIHLDGTKINNSSIIK